jgi:hypothetical protein
MLVALKWAFPIMSCSFTSYDSHANLLTTYFCKRTHNITLRHTAKSHGRPFSLSFSDTILCPFHTISFIRDISSAHLVILNLIVQIILSLSISHNSAVFRNASSYAFGSMEALLTWTVTYRSQSQVTDTVKVKRLKSRDAGWQKTSVGVLSHGDGTQKTDSHCASCVFNCRGTTPRMEQTVIFWRSLQLQRSNKADSSIWLARE